MNREILFRGKRKDNGEWIEGSGVNTQYDVNGKEHVYIGVLFASERYPSMQNIEWHEVIPETVGQYTGLTDKNGKKIFEGDIFKCYDRFYVVEWDELNARFLGFAIGAERFISYVGREPKIEVIGNIHDTPELLEVSK